MKEDAISEYGCHRPNAFLRGLVFLAQRAPRNAVGRQFAQFLRIIFLMFARPPYDVEVGSFRIRCHMRDNYSEKKFVFTPCRLDQRERKLLVEALPRDGVFVDIGANVGIYTLTAATHMGEAGRILAFEPNPPVYDRLRFNLEATRQGRLDWPQVDTLALGIGDREGTFELRLDPANLGASSIAETAESADGKDDKSGIVVIPCQPLHTVLKEQGIERIDALKIDIEGAEDLALCPFLEQAAEASLPRLLIVENSADRWKRDLSGMLAERGYTVHLRTRLNTVYRRGEF